jgi:beta-lactamase class A
MADLPTCYQPIAEPIDIEGTPVEPSERIASPGPVTPPPYYRPLALQEDPALKERLLEVLGDEVESYGIVVKSLEDGRGAVINPDKVFYAASLFKVTVLFEVFHQRALSLLGFQEELLITPYYARFDLGTLPVGVCDSISVGEALHAMTAFSDNVSAVLLQDRVGAANVNRSLAALGLETTRLLPDDLPTTAGEMALLMEMMARGEAVDAASSQEMVNLLAGEEIDNGLRAGLPEGTLVAHKTGLWTNATHDVGIVYVDGPSASGGGAAYVIAILSDKGPDDDAVPLAEISRVVYDYFSLVP